METEGKLLQFQPREVIGSEAYNIENERVYGPERMRADTRSYLSEYRLRVQKYDYEYQFSFVEGEGYKVRDIYSGEAMNKMTKRTLAERRAKGLPIEREIAEDMGIESLDEQLLHAQEGDRVFWISLPGGKGYGDYGFVFEGRVQDEISEDGLPMKRLFMTANRVETPTITQANQAFFELTAHNISYINAEGLLENPRLVGKRGAADTDAVLQRNFSFVVDQKEELINKQVITNMDAMINEFVEVIRSGSREQKITSFYALENYALELKERFMRKKEAGEKDNIIYMSDHREYQYLGDILSIYGYLPPIVSGSCGPTGEEETRSSNVFANRYDNLMKAIFGRDLKELFGIEDDKSYSFDKAGTCVRCKNETMLGPCNLCQGCDMYLRLQAK